MPLAAGLALALVLGGVGAFLGVLILCGGIGALVGVLLFFYDWNLRQNAEIRLAGGQLVLGRNAVSVAEIEAWTSHRRTTSAGGDYTPVAQVIFRVAVYADGVRGVRPDGGPAFETVHFGWGAMPPEELEDVRRALEPVIAASWVPLEQLRD